MRGRQRRRRGDAAVGRTTTKPLEAQIFVRLVDTNGRPVAAQPDPPVLADVDRIGIKPQFDQYAGLAEGSSAGFDIITVAPEGGLVASDGPDLDPVAHRDHLPVVSRWQPWKWEAITTTREVANGTIDTNASGPVAISAPVNWGRYVLEVESGGENPTSSSYEFYAGYYYAEAGSDTPDTLQVALDKPAYRVGDTAVLKLDPQFAGTALVMVVDDRIIDMQAVEVPADGTSVSLPVTEEWGPGAYVTAMLYRRPTRRRSGCRRVPSASPSPMSIRATASSTWCSMSPRKCGRAAR
jgi:uncharacterized protein YfaS (alpha-2-macroglobulin family)